MNQSICKTVINTSGSPTKGHKMNLREKKEKDQKKAKLFIIKFLLTGSSYALSS